MSPPTALHALSTMWSQGRFPHKDRDSMARFAEAASQLGFPAVEINYVIPPDGGGGRPPPDPLPLPFLHSPRPHRAAGAPPPGGGGGARGQERGRHRDGEPLPLPRVPRRRRDARAAGRIS